MSSNNVVKQNIKSTLFLTFITSIIWVVLTGALMTVFGFANPAQTSQSEGLTSMLALFGLCISNSIMVVWYTNRTVYIGRKLFTNVFILIFGVMSFMTQIETLFFNDSIKMPLLMIAITVFVGAVVGIVSGMHAVKLKKKLGQDVRTSFEKLSFKDGIGRIVFLSFLYMIFYFIFGYFIAWQFTAVREFYSGSKNILPFITHMINQITQEPSLIIFQIIRGFLWAMIGYTMLNGLSVKNRVEKYVLMGLLLSVSLATPLFAPNEFMPSGVRFGHFFELLIENFLFGAILTGVLVKERSVVEAKQNIAHKTN